MTAIEQKEKKGRTFLEIGFGKIPVQDILTRIHNFGPGDRYIGVDMSPDPQRARLWGTVEGTTQEFLKADGLELPLR